jgi:peptidyl-prolyl cis-trans isomerase D
MDNEAARIGLSVGDAEIRERILDIPAFRGLDGNFDREAYAFVLDNAGLSIAQFEDDVRRDVARTLVQGAVAGGVAMPEGGFLPVLTYLAERRTFVWVPLTEDRLAEALPEATEADLVAFHAGEAARFTLPEARRITWVALTPSDVMDDLVIPEERLMEAYERRIAEFIRPERRIVERLVYPSMDAAAEARARLDDGSARFAQLVQERGLSLDDVDMGDVTEAELGDGAAEVFALDEPGVVGPVNSSLGPALFRVNAILPPSETPFEDAAPLLLEEAAADAARRLLADRRDEVDDLLASGATLEELAETEGLTIGTLDWRPGDTDGIAAYESFRAAAAAVTPQDFPEVGDLEDGGIFALRLDEVVPPTLQPLEEIEDEVREAWRVARLTEALVAEGERLKNALSEGVTLSGLGLSARQEDAVARRQFVADTPEGTVAEVFEMTAGEVRIISDAAGNVALVRLEEVLPPDRSEEGTAGLEQLIVQELSQSLSEDVLAAFIRALEAQAGIRLDQQAIAAVNAQFN